MIEFLDWLEDRFNPGTQIEMRFIRMTAFPIGVARRFYIEHTANLSSSPIPFNPSFAVDGTSACTKFESIDQMELIRWRLPKNLLPGRCRILAAFCDNSYPDMPAQVFTPEFEMIGNNS